MNWKHILQIILPIKHLPSLHQQARPHLLAVTVQVHPPHRSHAPHHSHGRMNYPSNPIDQRHQPPAPHHGIPHAKMVYS
jgi:hypothetical protein